MKDALLGRSILFGDAGNNNEKKDDGKKCPLLATADAELGGRTIGREAGGGNYVANDGHNHTIQQREILEKERSNLHK